MGLITNQQASLHGVRLLADLEHGTLIDIVNTIRNNPADFAEWQSTETA